MIEVRIGDEKKVSVRQDKDGVYIDDILFEGKILKIDNSSFKVYKSDKIFKVEIIEHSGKDIKMKINGQLLEVKVSDHIDKILKKLGMNMNASNQVKEVKAPMPGSILSVVAKEGDSVVKGDQLLILEAMKMENVIKSPGDGVIGKIHIQEKENVEKNQVLVSFE